MKRWVLTALVCAAMLAAAAKADDLILNGAGGWSYMVVPFGQQPGFAASTYDSTGWQVGQGPWGGWETGYAEVCGLNSTIVTAWPNYTDLLLRRSLQLCAGASGCSSSTKCQNSAASWRMPGCTARSADCSLAMRNSDSARAPRSFRILDIRPGW